MADERTLGLVWCVTPEAANKHAGMRRGLLSGDDDNDNGGDGGLLGGLLGGGGDDDEEGQVRCPCSHTPNSCLRTDLLIASTWLGQRARRAALPLLMLHLRGEPVPKLKRETKKGACR